MIGLLFVYLTGAEGMKSDPEGAKSYFKKVKDN
jgi:hypothetical protein